MGLKQQAVKGVAWSSIGTIGYGGINLLITIILARFLSPSDFGLIELLIVFSVIADTIVDSGFSQAVIRDKNATKEDLSSVFYLNVIIGFTVYALLFFSAPLISQFYDAPELTWLARFVFLTIIFNSLSVVQNANLSRNLNFRPYALASIVGIIVSGIVAVILAINGYGVWALAANLVLVSFVRMCMLWVLSRWKPSLSFSFISIKRYFKFGVNLLIQGLIDKIVSNLESLAIGKYYQKSDLGYFSQGRKLDTYVVQTGSSVIQRVAYPLLAKVGDGASLKQSYQRVLGISMCLMAPVIILMLCGAEYIMVGVFGEQWLPAAGYLRLWSICGLCVSFHSIFINVFMVKGQSGLLLRCTIVKQILRIITIVSLVGVGIYPLMFGKVAVAIISALIYAYFGGKLIEYSIVEVMKDLCKVFISTFAAAIVSLTVLYFLPSFSAIISLLILCVCFALVYVVMLITLKDNYYQEILGLVKSTLKLGVSNRA